jgi:hypothetical protein
MPGIDSFASKKNQQPGDKISLKLGSEIEKFKAKIYSMFYSTIKNIIAMQIKSFLSLLGSSWFDILFFYCMQEYLVWIVWECKFVTL